MRAKHQPVHSVSAVASGLSADVRTRQRRYVASMAVRTACFLAAVVLPSPWRWILLVTAVVLPQIAVVIANGGRETPRQGPSAVILPMRSQLPSSSHPQA